MTNVRRELLMPSLAPTVRAARVSRWHVAEGQAVSVGDVLVEVATPTATLEIEAESEGHVERILVPAGTEGVEVDTPIAILLGAAQADHQAYGAARFAPLAFASLELSPARAQTPTGGGSREATGREINGREALRDALAIEMGADPAVFVIGADVAQNRGAPRVTQGLVDAFGPSRVVSVPAIDEGVIGLAVGAAFAGLKPVVELPSWGRALDAAAPYLASASETYYLSGGRLAVPIVFRGPNGFAAGMTGEEAHCVASLLAQIPGLKVVQPATPAAAKALLAEAIRDPGPVAVLEHEQLYAARGPDSDGVVWKIGKARLARAGRDVTLAAAGRTVRVALDAAETLAESDIEAEVVDLASVRPLDHATIATSVGRTGRLITIEDGWGAGGIGAELVATLVSGPALSSLKAPPRRLTGADVPMPYAAELQAAALPSAARVASEAAALIRG